MVFTDSRHRYGDNRKKFMMKPTSKFFTLWIMFWGTCYGTGYGDDHTSWSYKYKDKWYSIGIKYSHDD